MYYNEIERRFRHMARLLTDTDSVFDEAERTSDTLGPFYYGYTVSVGPDGRPVAREYGNIRPEQVHAVDSQNLSVETIVDDGQKLVKMVAEMPGVEKSDVKIRVESKTVNIDAERGKKKYHAAVPLKPRIDTSSAKASYKNGILELTFKQLGPEKPKGRMVEVE